MNVWPGLEAYPKNAGPVVATIGNYDGVHLGHRAILEDTVATARRRGLRSLLITFEPHPLEVVQPARRPRLLQTRRQRIEVLEAAGVDGILILRFDQALAALPGAAFFRDYLGSHVSFSAIRVGPGFRFGHGRDGDFGLLERIGAERGFDVAAIPAVTVGGEPVSSTAIRKAVADGDVARARTLLGRPFAIDGEVVRGDGRGRALAYPTANIAFENEVVPHSGVYVTETSVLAARWPSVTNVGVRPTFDGRRLTVETHLIDFDDDIYGERAEVLFLARLRDEMRFPGPMELADQIARDLAAAAGYFQGLALGAR